MILEGPVRQLRRQKQKDEAMQRRGRGAGCRLQSNFNEYQGEYPIFFHEVSFWYIVLNHCHTNKVFPSCLWFGLVTVSSCGTATSPAHLLCYPNWTDDLPICHVYLQRCFGVNALLCSAPSEHRADVSRVFFCDRSCSHYWIIHCCINVFR